MAVGHREVAVQESVLRDTAAQRLRVLGHPVRLHLVELLWRESATVTDLAAHVGLSADAVSKHLRELATIQAVTREQQGNYARYSLTDPDLAKLVALGYRSVVRDARRQQAITRLAPDDRTRSVDAERP